ncbi:MAG: hypothetical protein RR745_05750 [Bacilli bacterium]
MENREIQNATNDQIEILEDKSTNLSMRTKESLKNEFKGVDGVTDNDKMARLLELHRKFQASQDKFNVDSHKDLMGKSYRAIQSHIDSITNAMNEYEKSLNKEYIEDVADEMTILKRQIESEEVLNARIINLEKELELLNKRYEEKDMMVLSSKEKIEGLEASNKELINKNSDFVHKENDYVNQLREKDNEINSKGLEINKLTNDYENKLKSLEVEYKAKIEQLEIDNKLTVKEFENKLVEVDKEKAVLENKITSLETNVTNASAENKELKASIELVRKEAKEDIKELEKEHKIEIKALEKEVSIAKETNNTIALEKAKLEARAENLESNINALNETKKNLEVEIKTCNDSLKTKDAELSDKEKEKEKISAALSDAKVELEKNKKNLDKATKENKELKEQIKKVTK